MAEPQSGAPQVVRREDQARESNDRIARSARRMHFVARVPFLCECEHPQCRELVQLSLEEYQQVRRERVPLTAPGHDV